MRFVPASAYFDALLERLPTAKKRVVIHAMVVWWGPRTETLVPLLTDAAARGVEVRIVGDIYSKFQARLPRLARAKTPSWKHIEAVNAQLQAAGAHITYVGKLWPNPYKTRCHSKITLVDDLVFTFGGVNFADDSLQNHDYMLEMRDRVLADRLYKLVREIEVDPKDPLPDLREELDIHSTMLFDGGTPGQSVIYEAACDVVAEARKVYFVSQMCPSGRLAELITATENECYFIRPGQAEPPSQVDLIWDKLRNGIKNRYTGKNYIHAKFILTEGYDGSKHIISGSNNFSWRGIRYGTKEIALHSTDPKLWDTFYTFLQEKLAA